MTKFIHCCSLKKRSTCKVSNFRSHVNMKNIRTTRILTTKVFASFSGQDLPVSMIGPRITTSGKVDHMIMTFNKGIYHFKCVSSDSCFFEKEADELKISRSFHILLSVPAALVEDC